MGRGRYDSYLSLPSMPPPTVERRFLGTKERRGSEESRSLPLSLSSGVLDPVWNYFDGNRSGGEL